MDNNNFQQNTDGAFQPTQPVAPETIVQPVQQAAPEVVYPPVQQAAPEAAMQQPVVPVAPQGTRAPGKEIASLICGISSICAGVCGVTMCWVPVTGLIIAFVFGAIAIACGIVAKVLRKKAVEQASITTKKSLIGKNLATAGIITAAVGMVLAIILAVACVGALALGYKKAKEEGLSEPFNFEIEDIDDIENFDFDDIDFDEDGFNFDF